MSKKTISPSDWVGTWNYRNSSTPTSRKSKLIISESKADCVSPPWCSLNVVFKSGNSTQPCKIEKMDDDFRKAIIRWGRKTHLEAVLFAGENEIAGIQVTSYGRGRKGYFIATREEKQRTRQPIMTMTTRLHSKVDHTG